MIYKQKSNLNKTQTATMKFVSLMVGLVGNTLFFFQKFFIFEIIYLGLFIFKKTLYLTFHIRTVVWVIMGQPFCFLTWG